MGRISKPRCILVYALAPDGTSAAAARRSSSPAVRVARQRSARRRCTRWGSRMSGLLMAAAAAGRNPGTCSRHHSHKRAAPAPALITLLIGSSQSGDLTDSQVHPDSATPKKNFHIP